MHHFKQLQQRTAMYTGENTLKSIDHFLGGYRFALHQRGLLDNSDPLQLNSDFQDWVAYRLHFYGTSSGWCGMIHQRTQTEREAIDKFFDLLSEYRAREPHVVAKLVGLKKTYDSITIDRNSDGSILEKRTIKSYPTSISLVTYTDDPGFFVYSDTSDCLPSPRTYFPDWKSFESEIGAKRSALTIIDDKWEPRQFFDDAKN